MPYTYSTLEAEQPFDDWSALHQGQISHAGGGAVYHTRTGSLPTIQWEAAREGVVLAAKHLHDRKTDANQRLGRSLGLLSTQYQPLVLTSSSKAYQDVSAVVPVAVKCD